MPGCDHRVRLGGPRVSLRVRDRPRGARLHDVAEQPGRRRRPQLEGVARSRPAGGVDDELVALEHPDRRARTGEQAGCEPSEALEHDLGIQLAGQLAPGAREPLRERAGAPLELVQLAALERAACRAGDMTRQLELLVGEAVLRRRRTRARARSRRRAAARAARRGASRSPLRRPPRRGRGRSGCRRRRRATRAPSLPGRPGRAPRPARPRGSCAERRAARASPPARGLRPPRAARRRSRRPVTRSRPGPLRRGWPPPTAARSGRRRSDRSLAPAAPCSRRGSRSAARPFRDPSASSAGRWLQPASSSAAGTPATRIATSESQTEPATGSRSTSVAIPRIAAATPTHGRTSAVARPRSRRRDG